MRATARVVSGQSRLLLFLAAFLATGFAFFLATLGAGLAFVRAAFLAGVTREGSGGEGGDGEEGQNGFHKLDQLICLEHRSPLKWKVQAAEPQAEGQGLGCDATATKRRMETAVGLETLLISAMCFIAIVSRPCAYAWVASQHAVGIK
jgi:hypothetical protein